MVRWRKRARVGSVSVRGVGVLRGTEMLAELGRGRIAWRRAGPVFCAVAGYNGVTLFNKSELIMHFVVVAILLTIS